MQLHEISLTAMGRRLETNCWASKPDVEWTGFHPDEGIIPPGVATFRCLWDTGSDATFVTPFLAQALELEDAGEEVDALSIWRGASKSRSVRLTLGLPGGITIKGAKVHVLEVHAHPEDQAVDVVIGMDLICQLGLRISNAQGHAMFGFHVGAGENGRR
jgi:hypothetical protein